MLITVAELCAALYTMSQTYFVHCVVQLIRRVLRQSFILLQRRGWLPSDTSRLTDVLHVTVLDGWSDHIPDGIRFHLDDIFIEELDRTADAAQVNTFTSECALILCLIDVSE